MWKPIRKSKGTTKSERYLANLCEHTFLSLWSFPNLYISKSITRTGGFGRELCDLLVIFGNNILIFSDKDIQFRESSDVLVSWRRWFKKAVLKSAQQIFGAERWLRQNPNELYLDHQCTRPFPLIIEDIGTARFFRIAVTRNSYEPAMNFFGSNSTGSFIIDPKVVEYEHYNHPFTIGNIDPNRGYVHVFDEFTLDVVFSELDTLYDFVAYLEAKEEAILQKRFNLILGEENLLAYYFINRNEKLRPSLKLPEVNVDYKEFDSIVIGEDFWANYVSSPERLAIKEANETSYFWDFLIEQFSEHILDGTVGLWEDIDIVHHEKAIRILAAEGRLARRILAGNFLEKLEQVPSNKRSARICFSPTYDDTCFILALFPRFPEEDYKSYRLARIALMQAYGLVCKYKHPNLRYIAVIGMESEGTFGKERSQEIIVFDLPNLTEKEILMAKDFYENGDILSDVKILKTEFGLASSKKTKFGRNEPCPCGSGLKYKKCCLRRPKS